MLGQADQLLAESWWSDAYNAAEGINRSTNKAI
jgi:hypothetical protein